MTKESEELEKMKNLRRRFNLILQYTKDIKRDKRSRDVGESKKDV